MNLELAVAAARAADAPGADKGLREQLVAAGSAAAWLGRRRPDGPTPVASSTVRFLPWESSRYPVGFRALDAPPPVVFVRGVADPVPAPERCVAIVGARRCTDEARWVARDLAAGLVRAGFVVVSGLALGVDIAAHTGALDAGGRTLAVLPSDVDHPAPRRNHAVAEEIASRGGWLVSERPFGASVRARSFPRRNRLVAAAAGAVVVVEAAARSGTMSTVSWALQLGRPVGAVPGSVLSPASTGSNQLLAAGAGVVTCAADVVALMGGRAAPSSVAAGDADADAVLAAIPGASGAPGAWVDGAGIPAERARAALLRLLAAGALRRVAGGRVARVL